MLHSSNLIDFLFFPRWYLINCKLPFKAHVSVLSCLTHVDVSIQVVSCMTTFHTTFTVQLVRGGAPYCPLTSGDGDSPHPPAHLSRVLLVPKVTVIAVPAQQKHASDSLQTTDSQQNKPCGKELRRLSDQT